MTEEQKIDELYEQYVSRLRFMRKMQSGMSDITGPEWEPMTKEEFIEMIKTSSKTIEQGAELARKHEKLRDEILNNPDMPQELKDIIIENRIPDDKIVDLTGGKKIKYINPDTFEIEYE
jgi:hypothetical protein